MKNKTYFSHCKKITAKISQPHHVTALKNCSVTRTSPFLKNISILSKWLFQVKGEKMGGTGITGEVPFCLQPTSSQQYIGKRKVKLRCVPARSPEQFVQRVDIFPWAFVATFKALSHLLPAGFQTMFSYWKHILFRSQRTDIRKFFPVRAVRPWHRLHKKLWLPGTRSNLL